MTSELTMEGSFPFLLGAFNLLHPILFITVIPRTRLHAQEMLD